MIHTLLVGDLLGKQMSLYHQFVLQITAGGIIEKTNSRNIQRTNMVLLDPIQEGKLPKILHIIVGLV